MWSQTKGVFIKTPLVRRSMRRSLLPSHEVLRGWYSSLLLGEGGLQLQVLTVVYRDQSIVCFHVEV